MTRATYRLVVLRHGQSEWNARNLFTGWVEAALTSDGEQEAIAAGQLLAEHGLRPACAHTSLQRRAIRTADLALAGCDRDWIPVRRSWRLNSNHYGALQGRDKAEVLAEVGHTQLMVWRRSYDAPPPPLDIDAEFSQFADPRYALVPPEARPRTESLKDVTSRLLPYWYDAIVPDLRTGACVLVVSHGNTLRALIKHLDGISDELITDLNIPTGMPLAIELGDDMRRSPAPPLPPAAARWRPSLPGHAGPGYLGNAHRTTHMTRQEKDMANFDPAISTCGISRGIANASLIKPNQIGTVTETLEAMAVCHRAGYRQFVSHR